MKFKFFLVLLFISTVVTAQTDINSKIDTSNYYNYFHTLFLNGRGVTTAWLTIEEVVPIFMDELKKTGYDWLYDYALYKIAEGKYIVLSAYTRKSNFGLLYIEPHDMFPSKEHRKKFFYNSTLGVDYVNCEETPSGEPNFVKIKKLPKNIFMINENCYWYQYTTDSSDNRQLLTKETAFKILRQDVRRILSKTPRPTN